MRLLGVHARDFRFEAKEQATPAADAIEAGSHAQRIESECLVVFTAVESGDTPTLTTRATTDITDRARRLGVTNVVVYPYVHLTSDPAPVRTARRLLDDIAGRLGDTLSVSRAPFGWYKAFDLSCLGHPLSEWSAHYAEGDADAEPSERAPSAFTRYIAVDADGTACDVTAESFADCPAVVGHPLLEQFIRNELLGREDRGESPAHVDLMRRHELVDYCDVSEKGHYKWYPKGVLIRRLLLDYAAGLARDWGAFEMANPVLIRGDHNAVGELMGEFHERDYRVDGGRGVCYLRYASDPLGFPYMQNVRFSYRQAPLRVYEEASCFRNEQEGEVSGLKRVRNFTMTDMHAACATVDQARNEFDTLCIRFGRLMDEIIAPGRWVLGWEGTVDFYEDNRAWLLDIGRRLGVPAFFKLMPEMSHYYAMKNEYQAITADGANVQVSTVQWDVKDGERFDIGCFDDTGRKQPCPVIIHASSFGSIERTLCGMLESIAVRANDGDVPGYPTWLAPTQVRVIPVSDDEVALADEIAAAVTAAEIRADVDDRVDTVGKKIRNAEQEWVPFIAVVGPREAETGHLSVRRRSKRDQVTADPTGLIAEIDEELGDMPRRPMTLPARLSLRPVFYG